MTREYVLSIVLRPIITLIIFMFIVYPIKRLIWRFMPDGKLKQRLFKRL